MANPKLLVRANQALSKQASIRKFALQPPPPPGGDPAAGGAPPPGGDPSMGGAPPPGGDPAAGGAPPPMDPSMGGAPPPGMDPSMMGGAPPPMDPSMGGAGGPNPLDILTQKLDQMMQVLQAGSMNQAGPGGSPTAPGKPGKPDLLAMSMDIYQMKKYLFAIGNAMGIEPPPEIMDGPNRDPSTGVPMAAGAPGSTSDPATMAQTTQPQAKPQQGAIKPLEPMQPAFGDASGKTAQFNGVGRPFQPAPNVEEQVKAARNMVNEAGALAALMRAGNK